jgi:phospholipase C
MSKPDDSEQDAAIPPQSITDSSRREFLQASAAIAGSTLLSSCLSDDVSPTAPPLLGGAPDYFTNIKHLVVVMFENRSFDHLLGYLYSQGATPVNWPAGMPIPPTVPALSGQAQAFDGLWQFPGTVPATCEGRYGCNEHAGKMTPAFPNPGGNWNLPAPDPYEPWEHVRMQAFDIDRPLAAGDTPRMSGFMRSYADRIASEKIPLKNPPDPKIIMGSYTADQLPVLSTLARSFAVFDHWYCAVPSQTYCNRAFFHASTSYGFVTNSPWPKWTTVNTGNGTIFDVLESRWNNTSPPPKTAPWAVYFSGGIDPETYMGEGTPDATAVTDYVGLTGLIHYEVGRRYGPKEYPRRIPGGPQRFFPLKQFFCDVATGALPQYTFIEPLGGGLPFALPQPSIKGHDFHPPQPKNGDNGATDLRNGEEVIRQIYEAIRTSGTHGGHDYTQDTMLLIVFDEHGGTYDHAELQPAIPPDNSVPEAADCKFNWLGVRVPAIAISSYTLPGTILNGEMHHAAVIKTLFKMNPGAVNHLTERDKPASVSDLSVACNGTRAKLATGPAPWPALAGAPVPTACPGSSSSRD